MVLKIRKSVTVDAEDLPVNNGRDCEVVEDVGAVPPGVHVAVLAVALVVETVHLLRRIHSFQSIKKHKKNI